MKIAYCVLCHKHSLILEELVNQLSENDIYIHVDKKSNIDDFKGLEEKATFIKERVNVRWGHYSTIEAIINLMKATMKQKYDYIFLLSGDCLPIKTSQEINEFLSEHNGNEFVGVMEQNKEDSKRIKYVYNDYSFKKDKSFSEKIKFKIQNNLGLYKENNLYSKLPPLYKGCLWFTITQEFCKYVLEYVKENPWYLEAFKNSYCADELFIQTIICNSPFKDNIYHLSEGDNDNFMSLRYIDWSGPELPKILSVEDLKKIKRTDLLFARKFNESLNLKEYRELLKK